MGQTQTQTEPKNESPHVVQHRLEKRGTPVEAVEETSPGEYAVTVSREGGFSLWFGPTDKYRVKHIVGRGDEDTFTVHIVKKR